MEDLYGSMDRGRIPRYCSSPAINAILHEKEQICLQDHIRFAIDLKLDGPLMIPSLDLCIALGNILDNALRRPAAWKVQKIPLLKSEDGSSRTT